MKKKGFALVYAVLILSLVLSIFFSYLKSINSKSKIKNSTMNYEKTKKSVEEATSVAAYEMFLADQLITSNNLKIAVDNKINISNNFLASASGIQNILGYFTVKDSVSNIDITDQTATIKIWENDTSVPIGKWIYGKWTGTSPNFIYETYSFDNTSVTNLDIPLTKGGYFITSIKDITPNETESTLFSLEFDEYKIPILDIVGNKVFYPNSKTPKSKVLYHTGNSNSTYEIKLFKNVTLIKKSSIKKNLFNSFYNISEIVRSYNMYVTLIIVGSKNFLIQENDPNFRNYCALEADSQLSPTIGPNCGTDSNGNSISLKIISFIVEDITPEI